jgi:hypothetical protein
VTQNSVSGTATLGRPRNPGRTPTFQKDGAVTSTSKDAKTRVCKDCRCRKLASHFPADKWGRVDTRRCLQCVDEDTPLLMTASELARWLGLSVAEVQTFEPVGSYSPKTGQPIALYGRMPVTPDYLPAGWRSVFDE